MGSEMSLDLTPSNNARDIELLAMAESKGKTTNMPPLPKSDVSLVLPVIDKMKRNLAALEEAICREDGQLLKSTVEKALTQLASTEYEEVLKGIAMLRNLLSERYVYSYAAYLTDKASRIAHLLAKQLTNYQSMFSDQDFGLLLEHLCETLRRFIESPVPLSKQLTTETIKELLLAILPHLSRPGRHNYILNNILRGILRWGSNLERRDKVLTIVLRHYRHLLERSLREDTVPSDVKNSLTVIANLLENLAADSRGRYYSGTDCYHFKHLDTVFYELYKLFDVCFDITLSPQSNLKPLEALKEVAFDSLKRLSRWYWARDFWEPVPSAIWDQIFALIDTELKQLGRYKERVPFYMWLAEQKIKRAVDESEKKANDDKCSMQTSTETLDSSVSDDSASLRSQFVVVEPVAKVANGTSTSEALNSNSDTSTAGEVITDDDDETASSASTESSDQVSDSEDAEAVEDSSELVKPLKGLNSSMESILQEVQQMQAQMLQTQVMLAKLMAKMVADKKN